MSAKEDQKVHILVNYNVFQSEHAEATPSYDNARYCAIHITASQFLDKLCDAPISVA